MSDTIKMRRRTGFGSATLEGIGEVHEGDIVDLPEHEWERTDFEVVDPADLARLQAAKDAPADEAATAKSEDASGATENPSEATEETSETP